MLINMQRRRESIRVNGDNTNPHRNHIERNTLVVPTKECDEVFLERVPQFRQRWGYEIPLETVMFEDQRYKYGGMREVQDYGYDSD